MTRTFVLYQLVVLTVAAVLLKENFSASYPSNVFPMIVLSALVILVLLDLLLTVTRRSFASLDLDVIERGVAMRAACMMAINITYVSLYPIVGFYLTTFSFLCISTAYLLFVRDGWQRAFSVRSIAAVVLYAVLITTVIWVCFSLLLRVPVPVNPFI